MSQHYNDISFVAQAEPLERLLTEFKIRSVIEIGSFLGASALFFAQRVERVVCIDPFVADGDWANELRSRGIPTAFYQIFEENLHRNGVWHKVLAIQGRAEDPEVFKNVPPADMVYVDGPHDYQSTKAHITMYREKAWKLLAGDDYHCNEQGEPYFPGVRKAVKELLPNHLSDRWTWWSVL